MVRSRRSTRSMFEIQNRKTQEFSLGHIIDVIDSFAENNLVYQVTQVRATLSQLLNIVKWLIQEGRDD